MHKFRAEWIILCIIAALLAGMMVLIFQRQEQTIREESPKSPNFSAAERAYLEEHQRITIGVEKELAYLMGDGKDGYLPQYMAALLAPSGMEAQFIPEGESSSDVSLHIVTETLRRNMSGREYTAPLFQIEGGLFLRSYAEGPDMPVLLQEDRLATKKAEKLRYGGSPLAISSGGSCEQTVRRALRTDGAGILADRSTVRQILAQQGALQEFQLQEKSLYTLNACLLVEEGNDALQDILNQCIQTADRHSESFLASQRWLDGYGPVYMDQDSSPSYLTVLIVILSVLVAFFVYYISNRSMYQELNARMDKITESRNEMQTTFHGVRHLMAELSAGGEINELNQAFAENAPAGALHRRIWEVLDMEEDGRQSLRQMVEHGARGIASARLETGIGGKLYVIDVFPVEDARGQIARLLFVAIDVTQERMAKRQILQDHKMIAIGQLAAGVAHEIRNPLGIIRNYCYVLKTMEDEQVRAKAIEEIEHAVEASGGIINNLLDFSRISSGRWEEMDVEEHVRSLLALNETTLRHQNITLEIRCPSPIRTALLRESFDMILLNLVKNAVDAIREDGWITVALLKESDGFTMTVEDTGEGMEEAVLDEIFNPFFTTKGNEGTGLGLYIVYNETEKLNGDIKVVSRPGEGTTFRVHIPIRHVRGGEEA